MRVSGWDDEGALGDNSSPGLSFGVEDVGWASAPLVDMTRKAKEFGRDGDFLDRRIGTRRLPRLAPQESAVDLACQAVDSLLVSSPTSQLSDFDSLVVVTQNGDFHGLPHMSAILQSELCLRRDSFCFDVGLGCSGYVYALRILEGLISVGQIHRAMLVTVDPYSRILDASDYSTQLLFGDAATVSVVSSTPKWQMRASRYMTDGSRHAVIAVSNGRLNMDGKEVLAFAKREVPLLIDETLADAGLARDDIDLYLLHQGSRVVVESVASQFGDLSERFPVYLRDLGNTVSSTIPLLLARVANGSGARRLLLAGFGVGLSAGVAILEAAP